MNECMIDILIILVAVALMLGAFLVPGWVFFYTGIGLLVLGILQYFWEERKSLD